MDVSQAVAQRISTRAFLPDPLPEAEIRDWLEQAQRAPSGGNTQPWRTIVVTGDARDAVINMAAPVLAANPKGQPTDRPIYPKDLWEPHEARRRKGVNPSVAPRSSALGAPRGVRPIRDKDLYTTTNHYLQRVLDIMHTVF